MSDDPPRDQPIGSGVGRDPVEDALTAAAAAPVALGDERLAALEARIMGSVADGDDPGLVAAVGSAPVARVRRRNRAASLLAAAAVVLVIALGALTVSLLAADDDVLAIAAADRVVVELPDGEAVAGEAGTELPDGARLEVIGFVEIDGRRFGPGSYRIVDGEVVRAESELPESAATSDVAGGSGDGDSDSSDRPATANDERVTDGVGDGEDDDGSARTTVAAGDVGVDDPVPGNGGARPGGAGDDRPDGDVSPSPTDPSRSTAPQRPPDVTRPPAPTTAPVRPTTVPARPDTTVPSRRPTTPSTTTPSTTTRSATPSTTPSTTSTTTPSTTSTTTPSRTTVARGDGESRDGRS